MSKIYNVKSKFSPSHTQKILRSVKKSRDKIALNETKRRLWQPNVSITKISSIKSTLSPKAPINC